jgi:hypothetical protein
MSLAARIAKLEAKRNANANRVIGVIGSRFGQMVEDPDKPGHLKWAEHPLGFEAWATKQQADLQHELSILFDEDHEPKTSHPHNVGNNDNAAPLKPGQKAKNFIYLADGTEIKIKRN